MLLGVPTDYCEDRFSAVVVRRSRDLAHLANILVARHRRSKGVKVPFTDIVTGLLLPKTHEPLVKSLEATRKRESP